jgi:hypothetical protein
MKHTRLVFAACAVALVAGECILFDQATPILELLTASRERRVENHVPTDAEICEAIVADPFSREYQLVAASFAPGFLAPHLGPLPRVDPGRFGVHVQTLRIAVHHSMDGAVSHDLLTVVRNVVLRKVDAHWEVAFVQEVSSEGVAQIPRAPPDARVAFDEEVLVRHLPQLGTPCPRP